MLKKSLEKIVILFSSVAPQRRLLAYGLVVPKSVLNEPETVSTALSFNAWAFTEAISSHLEGTTPRTQHGFQNLLHANHTQSFYPRKRLVHFRRGCAGHH